MHSFSPASAIIGGLLIGSASAVLLVLIGRVAGISGIIAGVLERGVSDLSWQIAFLAGLLLAAPLYSLAGGALPSVEISSSAALLIIAGALVGFGSRLGSGCTSGHGVCGIGRASPRSIAATTVFLVVAIATVFT